MQVDRAPQVPRRDRSKRRPARAVLGERARRRHAAQSIGEAKSVAHAEVVDRQHIGPPEARHQHHLHGPAADAAHLRDAFDDLVIGERVQDFRRRNDAVEGLAREILDARDLGERQPDRAHLVVRCREHHLRFEHRRAHSIDGVQPAEAAEDAFRGGAIQLLMRDRSRQRMERRVLRARGVREFAGGANHVGKNRVDSRETAFECRELGGSANGSGCIHRSILMCKANIADAAASAATISGSSNTNTWSAVPA